ncbi:MAG: transporter substrate-binding domain-containing protein [Candidatus Edwardsbacteria bacterium]|nr:transporter substrate-binding domain-containing protein [Candidatus Edwardsbacteria bacterium]MBU1577118.1 transporter substrate-binding domain-containing protein [Candidatus Edwardsbacteria bacterium]MBU2463804.1 transporter substrate-binding domain-containing protein [Candidatus Edwardsbacteria bacterium]MBU2593786.1 transporter substrate-binding domain-containing protein [Candidatus Edwardsbacteria bacterium]
MSNQQNNQKVSVILLAVAALLFSINLAGAVTNDLPAKTAVPARPILVFGSDQDYPPYEWLDKNGQPQGFNVDLIRAIGQAMGYEVTVRLGPWARIREDLEIHGTVDVADMFFTEQRAKRVDFAEPFWVVHDEIFVRQGEKEIKSLDDLAGREVLCQEGGSIYDLLREDVPAAKLILVGSDPEALRRLASGRHDCAVVGSVVGRYTINRSGLSNLTATSQPLWPRDYCFVTAKGRPQLLADLNLGLAILKETGRFDEIYDKWFKEYLPRKPWLDKFLKYLPLLAFGLAALAIAVAAWILTLRHQVRGRTQKLQRTLLLLNEAQSITKLGGWEYDAATRRVTWTDEVYRIYGVPKNYDPAQPEQNIQFYAPEDRARVTDAFRRAVEQGESYDLDLRLITAQGVKKWVRTIGRAERRGEKIVRVSGNIMDITDRKQASEDLKASNLELISARNQTEEALRTSERSRLALLSVLEDEKQTEQELRESEERFRALHNASFGGIAIHDKGKILECNQGLSEITGYSMEELIGMDGMLLINKDSRDLVMENILAGYEKPYEALGLRKNGETYPIRLEARNIPYKGKSVRTVEFRDITERNRAEEKMKGQLAELQRWQNTMLDREDRVMELKKEINELLEKLGQPKKYGK